MIKYYTYYRISLIVNKKNTLLFPQEYLLIRLDIALDMMRVVIYIRGTFEGSDSFSDIGRVVRVDLDPIVLSQRSDIGEEHRKMIGTCELDTLSSTIIRSDVDPPLSLCIEGCESRIIEVSEIAY